MFCPEITMRKTIVMKKKNKLKVSQRDYSLSLKLKIVSEMKRGLAIVIQARNNTVFKRRKFFINHFGCVRNNPK
jgi:hypothetical protein